MTEENGLLLSGPAAQSTSKGALYLTTLVLLSTISLPSAGVSATLLPNWNRYTRGVLGHASAQTFAYIVSEGILQGTLRRQVVPVLSFSCIDQHLNAEIFFNQFRVKSIKQIDFKVDGSHLTLNSWVISRANRSIDYASDVPTMIHALYGRHTLRMRLVGQAGQMISATFDVNQTRLGTSAVRKACQRAGRS